MCERERERGRESVCEREKERERECVCVCVCVCVREREREREREIFSITKRLDTTCYIQIYLIHNINVSIFIQEELDHCFAVSSTGSYQRLV